VLIILNPDGLKISQVSIFLIKKCATSALTESKSKGIGVLQRGETWWVNSAIFKFGTLKSQVYETWGPKVHFSLVTSRY